MNYDFTENNNTTMMLCPEGTAYWALNELIKGNDVELDGCTFSATNGHVYAHEPDSVDDIGVGWDYEYFLGKYRGYHSFKLKRPDEGFRLGEWVVSPDGDYYEIHDFSNEKTDRGKVERYAILRPAGSCDTNVKITMNNLKGCYEPIKTSIDFSTYHQGDMVFSLKRGYEEIREINDDDTTDFPIRLSEDDRYSFDGYSSGSDVYPTLFTDHWQAMACIKELYMDMNKEGES